MAYRDDLDAARARADALEKELADARAEIAELKGEPAPTTALATREDGVLARRAGETSLERNSASGRAAHRYLGGPTRLELARTIEGELPESGYTELVETIRERLSDPGTTSILPGSLTWSSTSPPRTTGPFINIYLTVRDGTTKLRADAKLGPLAGAIYGGVGGGVGGGAIMAPLAAAFINPALLAITVPVWLGGMYWGCRKLFRGRAKKRSDELEELVDELAALCERLIAESAGAEAGA